jgi:hypothetical protein
VQKVSKKCCGKSRPTAGSSTSLGVFGCSYLTETVSQTSKYHSHPCQSNHGWKRWGHLLIAFTGLCRCPGSRGRRQNCLPLPSTVQGICRLFDCLTNALMQTHIMPKARKSARHHQYQCRERNPFPRKRDDVPVQRHLRSSPRHARISGPRRVT